MGNQQIIDCAGLSKTYRVRNSSSFWHPSYREIPALQNIAFTHEDAGNMGIFGRNGAGKTTLIKLLTGILHPTAGQVSVLGFTPQRLSTEFKRQIGLFQGGRQQLIWDIPACDSLLLSRYIYRYSRAEFDRRLAAFTKALEIGEEIRQPLRNLSLGQRTKMELIYSFLHLPRLVFLDEPTSGLDVLSRASLREFINFCHAEFGMTFLITSHNVKDIIDCCPTCLVLDHGHILYRGDTNLLLEKHRQKQLYVVFESESDASQAAERFNGITAGVRGKFDLGTSDERELVSKLTADYQVLDLRIVQKDDEDIVAEILRHA
jgi:ABC-2 type transport system ATP-binding protein